MFRQRCRRGPWGVEAGGEQTTEGEPGAVEELREVLESGSREEKLIYQRATRGPWGRALRRKRTQFSLQLGMVHLAEWV